jgi:hypothetical protein
VRLELPYPKGITAHNKGRWSDKSKEVANLRLIAKCITLDAIARGQEPVKGPHVINYYFQVPDNRQRDRANMIQQCKALIDGIVDAGGIEGDHWQISWIGAVIVQVTPKKAGVVLQILPKISQETRLEVGK